MQTEASKIEFLFHCCSQSNLSIKEGDNSIFSFICLFDHLCGALRSYLKAPGCSMYAVMRDDDANHSSETILSKRSHLLVKKNLKQPDQTYSGDEEAALARFINSARQSLKSRAFDQRWSKNKIRGATNF